MWRWNLQRYKNTYPWKIIPRHPGRAQYIHKTSSRNPIFAPIWEQKPILPPTALDFKIFCSHLGAKISSAECSHYYVNTTSILSVQRPILFHLVSLECIGNLGWRDSIHTPRCWGCQIRCIGVVGRQMMRFWIKNHTSHKKHPHHDASHGIIGHVINNNNNPNTLSDPKFCAESIFEVGGAWISMATAV